MAEQHSGDKSLSPRSTESSPSLQRTHQGGRIGRGRGRGRGQVQPATTTSRIGARGQNQHREDRFSVGGEDWQFGHDSIGAGALIGRGARRLSNSAMEYQTASSPTSHCQVLPQEKLPSYEDQFSVSEELLDDTLEVNGLSQQNSDKDLLEDYFNHPISGGEDGGVIECTLKKGAALIKFKSKAVASCVISKTDHKLKGQPVTVHFARREPEPSYDQTKLLLSGIPRDVSPIMADILKLHLRTLRIFASSVEIQSGDVTAIITFKDAQTMNDLDSFIEKIQGEPLEIQENFYHLCAQKIELCTTLVLRNISKTYDEETITFHFSSRKRSGGGKLQHKHPCELLGDGVAKIHFENAQDAENVLQTGYQSLSRFGENVTIEKAETILEMIPCSSSSLSVEPLLISPLLAFAMNKHFIAVKSDIQHLFVDIEIKSNGENNQIFVSPTNNSPQDWFTQFNGYFADNYVDKCIQFPKEVFADVFQLLEAFSKNPETIFAHDPLKSITEVHVAGSLSTVSSLEKDIESLYARITYQHKINNAAEFAFLSNVTLSQFQQACPEVKTTLDHSNYIVQMQGTRKKIDEAFSKIPTFCKHDSYLVELTDVQKSYVNSQPGNLTLTRLRSADTTFFVCNRPLEVYILSAPGVNCQSMCNKLSTGILSKCLPVPMVLKSLLSHIPTFKQCLQSLTEQRLVIIEPFDSEVRVSGMVDDVMYALDTLHAMLVEEEENMKPLSYSVTFLLHCTFLHCAEQFHHHFSQNIPNFSMTISKTTYDLFIAPKRYMPKMWRKEALSQVEAYITNNYLIKELVISGEAITEAYKVLLKYGSNRKVIFYSPPNQEPQSDKVTLAGECQVVKMVEEELTALHFKYTKIKEQIKLSRKDYSFISQVQIQFIQNKFRNINFQVCPNSYEIQVSGTAKSIQAFKEELPQFLSFSSIEVQASQAVLQFLCSNQQIYTLLKMHQLSSIAVFFERSNHSLTLFLLYRPSDLEKAQQLATAIPMEVVERLIKIPKTFETLSPKIRENCNNLYSSLQASHHIAIQENLQAHSVIVTGFSKDVELSIQEIESFFSCECNITKLVVVSAGKWRLLEKNQLLRSKWSDIQKTIEETNVKIITEATDNGHLINISGDKFEIEDIFQIIQIFWDGIYSDEISVRRPGTAKILQGETWEVTTTGIETKHNVVIDTTELEDSEVDPKKMSKIPNSISHQILATASIPTSTSIKNVYVVMGDISEFEADVIVNAANQKLDHGGGVAGKIVRKGGQEIQTDCSKYVTENGPLRIGVDVYYSTVTGNLPCKALIHAVGPEWQGGHMSEENSLKMACIKSLMTASSNGHQSIALPAISAGVYEFPLDCCAKVLVTTACSFLKETTGSMTHVNFVVLDENAATHFITALYQELPQSSIHTVTPKFPAVAITDTQTTLIPEKVVSRIKVEIVPGSIMDYEAEVLVNSTNEHLDLKKGGAISSILLREAGDLIQQECSKLSTPVFPGDIAITNAGNLPSPCKKIFHAVCEKFMYDQAKVAQESLKSCVRKCLEECKDKNYRSIAFPTIGIGNLNFTPQSSARNMIEAILKFSKKKENQSFTLTVFVVVYEQKHFEIFSQEYESLRNRSPSALRKVFSGIKKKFISSPKSTLKCFEIGKITLEVEKGDITDDTSDCIINPTNSDLKLEGGGVAGALRKKGGMELQSLCTDTVVNKGRLTGDKVLDTAIPNNSKLKCKAILHMLSIQGMSDSRLQKSVLACLKKAEELMHQSVALPAVGTGVIGLSVPESTRAIKLAIGDFSLSNPSHVLKIRLVLFDDPTYQAVLTELDSTVSDEETDSQPAGVVQESAQSSGVLQSIASAVGSGFASLFWSQQADENAKSTPVDPIQNTKNYHGIKITVLGACKSDVDKALSLIQQQINATLAIEKITDANISFLSADFISSILQQAEEKEVEFIIERSVNMITLHGEKKTVTLLKKTIENELRSLTHQNELNQRMQTVHCQWKRIESFKNIHYYDLKDNYHIEQAYIDYLKSQNSSRKQYLQVGKFKLDFSVMNASDDIDCFRIKRDDMKGDICPDYWEPMPVDPVTKVEKLYYLPEVQRGSKEYQHVMDQFNLTMIPQKDYKAVVRIKRIQRPHNYFQYARRKTELDQDNPPGWRNERWLFHGTSPNAINGIVRGGFDRSYAGTAVGTLYGRGCYFAKKASYSHRYATPNSEGLRYMYFVRVLVGEYTKGNERMLVPPPKDPKNTAILYDSVVDNVSNPEIFVVFKDDRAYPEYLIIYKE